MRYSSLVFDFDGTLADTAKGIVATMARTYEELGVSTPNQESMKSVIGLPLITALKQAANLNDAQSTRAVEIYKSLFATVELGNITLFEGVKETLETFQAKGVRMAIATSRNRESLETIMQRYNLMGCFDFVATNNDGYAHKPAPDMVWAALNYWGIRAQEALVVGDTTFDLEMGRRAGCHTCGVSYGNHSAERLKQSQPDYLIDAFATLQNIVQV